MTERVNPFGDLNDFAPEPKAKPLKDVQKEAIDQVAAENDFPSRQPPRRPLPAPELVPTVKSQRRYRTGRNQQINLKATAETIDHLYRVADRLGVPLGEVLMRALEALDRDIK